MATASDKKKKNGSAKSSSSSSKKPSSGSRASSGGTRSSASGSSRASSAASTSKKSSAGAHEAPKEAARPIRREVWAVVFLIIGLLSILGYFGADSIFHKIFCTPLKGLMGYGYYVFPPAMLVCFGILMFHKCRPVRMRTYLTIAIPFLVGALTHIIKNNVFDFGNIGTSVKTLYASGKSFSSGGVFCGFLGSGLSALISPVGAVLVLIVLLIIAIALVFKISPAKIAENVKTRERPQYIPKPEPEHTETKTDNRKPAVTAAADAVREPEFVAVPNPETKTILPHAPVKPSRKLKTVEGVSDIDVPLEGDETPTEPKKKAGFFNNTPNVKTPGSVFLSSDKQTSTEKAAAKEHFDIPIYDGEPELTDDAVPTYTVPAHRFGAAKAEPAPARPAAADTLPDIPAAPAIILKAPSAAAPISIEEAAKIAGVAPELAAKPDKDELFPSDRPKYSGEEEPADSGSASLLAPLEDSELPKAKLGAKELQKETELIGIEAEKAAAAAPEAYVYPPVELLAEGKASAGESASQLSFYAESLSSTLHSFGVNAKVVDTISGPTVTRYDLQLEAGVKLSRITGLADDIALALGVSGVRIAPIPGKAATVGVEVPNSSVSTVYLRSLVDSRTFREAKSRLTFAIGKDIGGSTVCGNISKLPHLLIAGTTGSGKSVCMNCLILSLLYKSSPKEVQFIMVDPKRVELGIYNGIPHLRIPVVTDPKKAAGALQWAVVQMLKRYGLFQEAGVRELSAYNEICVMNGEETLPQLVVIIDELADLMFVASKEVEESICRIAQMGRAAGIHLVIATQRPSADVITGLMKANIPSRISFAVSSAMESRIILDQAGAEKLLGMGDMLYSPIGSGKPLRVQGAFVTDDERERIVSFIKNGTAPSYDEEAMHEIEKAAAAGTSGSKASSAADDDDDEEAGAFDELLPQAVDVVLDAKMCSVSLLQRKVKLGYSRAARIVDQMEELGIVGPHEGAKPRQVLITREQWIHMQSVSGNAPIENIPAAAEAAGTEEA